MSPNLLEKASDWLETKRTQYASRVVTYVRGSRSVEVPATIGKTTFEIDDGYGVMVRYESRDFLILAADLIFDGHPEEPQRGDQIRETQNQKVFVYEVSAPDKTPCWRYSDAFRKTFRIHTKQVENESAI